MKISVIINDNMSDNLKELLKEFDEIKAKNYQLNIARGKPNKDQLDLSNFLLKKTDSYISKNNIDVRNYGELTGLDECKEMFASMLDVNKENVIVFGNSSLNIMFSFIANSYIRGIAGEKPWCKLDKVKWLCPVPGYDRHFTILEYFNIEMIPIPMDEAGPNMDLIEALVESDPSIKGMWSVPIYSNPTGDTYSDEVVRRLVNLKPISKDFRIYFDEAYYIHHLFNGHEDKLLNIFEEAKKANNEDLIYIFASTSKITFPGAGVSSAVLSKNNQADFMKYLSSSTIGYDKINQLKHASFFKNKQDLLAQMRKHAEIIRPKFEMVISALEDAKEYCTFTKPNGGYFISVYTRGVAKEVIARCLEAGLTLTGFGSGYPYHNDVANSHLRIAPTYLSLEDLKIASHILVLAIKIETLFKENN